MKVIEIDPRDAQWEIREPIFRVSLWNARRSSVYDVEVQDATIDECLQWIRTRAQVDVYSDARVWELFLRASRRGEVGLIRLGEGVFAEPDQVSPN